MRRRYKRKPIKPQKPRYRVNEHIRVPVVFVVDEKGEKLGEMETGKALEIAHERELDLVEVAPNAQPPVCKIISYGKFQYSQSKQDRLSKAKQKKTGTKGIRLGMRTDEHDLAFKKKQAEKFLSKGHKVKIELRLKGREKAHQDLAKENLRNFVESLDIPYKIEDDIKKFPGGFNVVISAN
ncbi:MAG TPA: translation initiation factor IF-3 [Candidatus Moranbacteria bacterium]|nr:translation initiation factor IF-3 [Candidatus Moranbacteria bacterium]